MRSPPRRRFRAQVQQRPNHQTERREYREEPPDDPRERRARVVRVLEVAFIQAIHHARPHDADEHLDPRTAPHYGPSDVCELERLDA